MFDAYRLGARHLRGRTEHTRDGRIFSVARQVDELRTGYALNSELRWDVCSFNNQLVLCRVIVMIW